MLTAYAGWMAWSVPGLEISIAIMLCTPRLLLWGLHAAFGLMVMFTAYIVAILHFSETIPCSCGGVLENLGWTEHLFFNVVFIFLGFTGVALSTHLKEKNDTTLEKSNEKNGNRRHWH